MNYTKPTILQTVAASEAVQSGSNKPDTFHVDAGLISRETPGAYEADE